MHDCRPLAALLLTCTFAHAENLTPPSATGSLERLSSASASSPTQTGSPAVRPLMRGPGPRALPDGADIALEWPTDAASFASPRALSPSAPRAPSPPASCGFVGVPDPVDGIPPDAHGAVGPTTVVSITNNLVRLQTRAGALVREATLDAFWVAAAQTTFDPKVIYDPEAGRFIAAACRDPQIPSSRLCLATAASDVGDLNWPIYCLSAPSQQEWLDYPSIGVTSQWVVVSASSFTTSTGIFAGTPVWVIPKAELYSGTQPTFFRFDLTQEFVASPALNLDPGVPTAFVVTAWNERCLELRRITGAVDSPQIDAGSFFCTDAANSWAFLPPTGQEDFLPQAGSPEKVDPGDDRIIAAVLRNGHVFASHGIFLPQANPTRASAQWWELDPAGVVVQRGRLDDPTGTFHFAFPSLAVNGADDVLVGFSLFSASEFAAAAYAFRAGGDPAGTLRDQVVAKAGEASYFRTNGGPTNRWGDYSATCVDPSNDSTFWTVQAYAATPNADGDRANTWWACVAPPSVDSDGDGVSDPSDNCPAVGNANQIDFDGDGRGDVCDGCRLFADPGQADTDGDGVTDACELVWGDVAPAAAPDRIVNVSDVVRSLRFAVLLETPNASELAAGNIAPASEVAGSPPVATPTLALPRVIDVTDVVLSLRASVQLVRFSDPR